MYLIFAFFVAFGLSVHAQLTISPGSIKDSPGANILWEDFNGVSGIPAGWTDFTEDGWDMMLVQNDAMMFFKQSTGVKLMILSTQQLDLNNASLLTFDFSSALVPSTLKVGIMTNPTNPSTFQQLTTFQADTGWNSYQVPLGTVNGTYYLAFNWVGQFFKSANLDNVLVVDDAVQNNIPTAVNALALTAAPAGAPGGTISWINPSLEADGDPLTDLDSIVVKLNDTLYTTLHNPPIGQPQTLNVIVTTPGFYTAALVPYNTAGEGVSSTTDPVWLGLDTPGEPINVTLTQNGNLATISWSPPAVGEHGAWYNGVVTEYTVTRADNNQKYLPGTDTSLVWDITDPGTFNFKVTPYNTSGEGVSGISNQGAFLTGNYLLYEDFWVDVPAFLWTVQGEDYFNWMHFPSADAGGTAPELLFQSTTPGINGNFRMVSPPLNTTGKNAVTLEFMHSHSWASGDYQFKVETSSDGGVTWHDNWAITVSQNLSAEKVTLVISNADVGSATFQFAFTYSGYEGNVTYFFLDNIRLYPTAGTDLAANTILVPVVVEPADIVTLKAVVQSLSSASAAYTATFVISNTSGVLFTDSLATTIQSGAIDTLTFAPWPAAEGENTSRVFVRCLLDDQHANDTATAALNVYKTSPRKLVIMEDATGTWCTYCPGAAMGIADLLTNGKAIAAVSYHGGDTYETADSRARIDYYGITGYPTMMFDGVLSYVGGTHSTSLYSDYLPLVDKRLAIASPVQLSFGPMQLQGNDVSAPVTITSLSPVRNNNLVMHAVLTESHIPENWQDQTELNEAARLMYGGAEGVAIDLADKSDMKEVQFTLSSGWVQANLQLVAWVQDTVTKEIFGGEKGFSVGLEELNRGKMQLYPNPASAMTRFPQLENGEVTIYDLTGKEIIRLAGINGNYLLDVSWINNGLYLVNISSGGKEYYSKLSVIH